METLKFPFMDGTRMITLSFPCFIYIICNVLIIIGGIIMSIRNAGLTIKEARFKAGLTQEQLAEGICTVHSLSRIENNTAGVSPSTFQALMARTGIICETFPTFANRTDFECFYTLKRSRFYIDSWQLNECLEELEKIELMNWANNKFYYQEWALLHCKVQFRSYCCNHENNLQNLTSALQITRPDLDISNFRCMLLSIVEIELLIALAQEYLYIGKTSECIIICEQISSYINNSQFTSLDKERFLAEAAIVYCKYYIATKNYSAALETADTHRHQMVLNAVNSLLFELTFLTGLSHHYLGNSEKAFFYFETVFYSAHSINSIYASACYDYWLHELKYELPDYFLKVPPIKYQAFPTKKIISNLSLRDGTYDLFSSDVITIGKLIQLLRKEQKISQLVLCQGLCSKSMLSKIENNVLLPSISLAEALLQRLGISDRVFTFYGDDHEMLLHELKTKCMHSIRQNLSHKQFLLSEMKQQICKEDFLYYQYYLFEKADIVRNIPSDFETKSAVDLLTDSLHITLPDFCTADISKYRLSWAELTILNRLFFCHRSKTVASSNIYNFQTIMNYFTTVPLDIILQSHIFPISLAMFIDTLYSQNFHNDVVNCFSYFQNSSLKLPIQFLGICYFYYCQSLGECQHYDEIPIYAHYACGIHNLLENFFNSQNLKQFLFEDFNINIP